MKKLILRILFISLGAVVFSSCTRVSPLGKPLNITNLFLGNKEKVQIVYFNPEIHPNVEEILFPSYQSFFSAVSNRMSKINAVDILRVQNTMPYDSVDIETIREICRNNDSEAVVIPKIKFFKVGFGKYVFSNQVEISMKLYNSEGEFIIESTHNTYRKNKRLLGSTENSIKIGTEGAINQLIKEIRILKRQNIALEKS